MRSNGLMLALAAVMILNAGLMLADCLRPAHAAQQDNGPWKLGTIETKFSSGNGDTNAALWKVKDGNCLLYVVVGPSYNTYMPSVAITAGQGCR